MWKKEDAGVGWVSFSKNLKNITVVLYLNWNDQSELMTYALYKMYLPISYLCLLNG